MKKIILSLIFAGSLFLASSVSALEIQGALTTGLEANNVQGIVIGSPIAIPAPNTYSSARDVVLSASGSQNIRYTTNNTDPSCSTGTVYSTPIHVSESMIIKAISCYNANNVSSSVVSFSYVINNSGGGGGGGGGGAIILTTASKTADANRDGRIDSNDFTLMMIDWEKTGANLSSDLNKDGKVDIKDFNLLMVNWGK